MIFILIRRKNAVALEEITRAHLRNRVKIYSNFRTITISVKNSFERKPPIIHDGLRL